MQRDPEQFEINHLHDFANLKNTHVLEIGCGDGRLSWRYAHHTHHLTAIDPDLTRLNNAITARPESLRDSVTFICSQAETLPFASDTFDSAILAWSL